MRSAAHQGNQRDLSPLEDATGVERYDIDDTNHLYRSVWGPSVHFGLWDNGTTDIQHAVTACKFLFANTLGIEAGQTVLEVGSGLGETARFLGDAYGCSVVATNVSESHLRDCQTATVGAGMADKVTSANADFHDLPFESSRFDHYIAQEALVHATDKQRVFSEAYRVLKPGGRIAFSDQTTLKDQLTDEDCARIAQRHGSDDLYDAADFARATRSAGFNIIEQKDLSPHMARHFAELVRRLEGQYDDLVAVIAPAIVDWNLETWRFARDKALAGGMGWVLIAAEKPR